MNCVINFTIKGSNGDINIDVPFTPILEEKMNNGEEITIKDVISTIKESGQNERLKDIISEINNSGFKRQTLTLDTFEDGLPLGNYSIDKLFNLISYRSDFDYLLTLAKSSGVDLNSNNVLLINSNVDNSLIKSFTDEDTGRKLFVLGSDKKLIHNYIISEISLANYDKLSVDKKKNFDEAVIKLLDSIHSPRGNFAKIISSIKSSKNKSQEFIRAYYLNKNLFSKLKGLNLEDILLPVFDNKKAFIESFKDQGLKDLVTLVANSQSRSKVSLDEINKLAKANGFDNPIQYIHELNRKAKNRFVKIKYVNDKFISFDFPNERPKMTANYVNSAYLGDSNMRVINYHGYNIFKSNNSFYIRDSILTSNLDEKNKFETLEQAYGIINYKIGKDEFRTSQQFKHSIKFLDGKNIIESKQSAIKDGDQIAVLDVNLFKTNTKYFNSLLGTTYQEFFTSFYSRKENSIGFKLRSLMNNSLGDVIDNQEKLRTMIALMEMEASNDPNSYKLLGNGVVTSDYIQYIAKLMDNALNIIKDAKEVVYEVTKLDENKFSITKVESELPLYQTEFKDFSSPIIDIAESLELNFGVKVNIINTSELKELIGTRANTTRACIFGGDVFINIDKATTGDIFHEYAHLIFGYIKQSNPEIYLKLVEVISNHPMYSQRLERLIKQDEKNKSKRTLPDLQEELFVTMFGEFMSDNLYDKSSLEDFIQTYKESADKIFNLTSSTIDINVAQLNSMSLDEVFASFGTKLMDDYTDFDFKTSYESRTVTNIISDLLKNNKLSENCE